MSFSVAPLLIHSEIVPPAARAALRAAQHRSSTERSGYLQSAARILHHELALECDDARELVGLPPGNC